MAHTQHNKGKAPTRENSTNAMNPQVPTKPAATELSDDSVLTNIGTVSVVTNTPTNNANNNPSNDEATMLAKIKHEEKHIHCLEIQKHL